MNRVVDQPVLPGGELDALLGTFFEGEMARPWPAFEPPERSLLPLKPAKQRPRFVFGSRLALAASVLVLLLCGWLLSGKFPGSPRPDRPSLDDPGTARPMKPGDLLVPDFIPKGKTPGKVKSNLSLEQDAAGTGIRVDVEEISPKK